MKYCVDFYNHLTNYQKADEYTIKYTDKNNILIDFLETNKTKRVNLTIEKELKLEQWKDLKVISNAYPNLFFRFEYYTDEIAEMAAEYGVPFFFANRVNTWDELLGLIELGVTDIYIVEDLCFDLEAVANIAHQNMVQLRTYANVAQSSWKHIPGLKTFWIRPEDIEIYEPYIDVLEFFGTPQVINILLKVYVEDKQWFGKLSEIIIGLKEDFDSRYIAPDFAKYRVNCQKKCLSGTKCKLCDRVIELSKTLKDNNLLVVQKKHK